MPYNVLLGKMVVGISFVQLFQCNDNIIEKKKRSCLNFRQRKT